ncbi:NAD(P)/FAD-dependent oxidoreductase [Rathayibacter soli]|uniref:NAD(P)/FAD-dependent oxidoreductase n=1 Tax=Rathayibacter soli TaxID=3144168 RepID=UPI0027E3DA84|nr:FAD-dependent oxidoreductase [Glaciibacter superstes]
MSLTTVFERDTPSRAAIAHLLEGSQLDSFWVADAPGTRRPALAQALRSDLVVVGGGYLGLWAALLAKREDPARRVVLLEARRIGWAASGRNGGFCEASLTHGELNGMSRFPKEFDRLQQLGRENLDAIESTLAELSIDAEFERNGAFTVAVEPHQVEWAREAAAEDGVEFFDQAAMRREIDSPTYLAGALNRRDTALVHPAKLAAGLADACEKLGVEIFEESPAANLVTESDGSVLLQVNGHVVSAGAVVLATNAFPSLLKRNRLMTVPVYDYVLMTEPLTDAQRDEIGWKGREGLADMGNQFHYYRLTSDNRILFGGYDAIYHYGRAVKPEHEDRRATFEKLAGHLLTTFPQLEGITATHRWSGAIDACSRFCAFYGVARKGRVAYAAGFTGLGVGSTRFAARVLLDLLAGQKTELTELEMVRRKPTPFPPEPLASVGINLSRWALNRADHNEGRRNIVQKTLDAVGLGFDS